MLGGIEQTFNQVKAKDTDRNALHFLWREPPGKTISDYQMTTHLFGKIDFPCCSNFANKKCSGQNRYISPVGCKH